MPQNNKKKIPERKCVGCGVSFPKKELIRIVRTPESKIELDFIGKKSGRGAYVCRKSECLSKARKAKRIERSLEIAIPEPVYDLLEAELKRYADEE